jgi:hypothetical protein
MKAQHTFDKLKEVMSSCSVLALLDFNLPFMLECDALGECIWAMLIQNHHSIEFEIQKILGEEQLYSIYDKEMLAIMHALTKFRQYLVGEKFVVQIDHNSLRYFL